MINNEKHKIEREARDKNMLAPPKGVRECFQSKFWEPLIAQ